jgi:hypothetical protein
LGTWAQNRVSGNLPVVNNLSHGEMHVFLLIGSGGSHNAVIRVYDDGGSVIKTHEHAGDFNAW